METETISNFTGNKDGAEEERNIIREILFLLLMDMGKQEPERPFVQSTETSPVSSMNNLLIIQLGL